MSAARNIPIPEATWTISIDSTFTPTPTGKIVGHGDTVNFANNSGAAITIQFAPNSPSPPVSSNLSAPKGGGAGFVAPTTDAAANYFIYEGVLQRSGPWAIQVGNGIMYITVNNAMCAPDPLAIPGPNGPTPGGNVAMCSSDGKTYNVNWPNLGDPFSPQINSVNPCPASTYSTVQPGSANINYGYTVASAGPAKYQGGGTVKVGGS
jgi:hypothetical protein